ncbi:MAG: hypothetical protein ACRCS9_00715 [Hyphomicrobium sp.]
MNDDDLRRKKARAARIAELAKGEGGLFEIFDAVERNYLETLVGSSIEDAAVREKVYHRVNALRDIRRLMTVAIADGNAASAIIEKLSRTNTGRKMKV